MQTTEMRKIKKLESQKALRTGGSLTHSLQRPNGHKSRHVVTAKKPVM